MKNKNKVEENTVPKIKTYYITTVMETVCVSRLVKQRIKIENSEIDSHKYANLIFDKMF